VLPVSRIDHAYWFRQPPFTVHLYIPFFHPSQWARYLAERYQPTYSSSKGVLMLLSISTDIPTFEQRVDDSQSGRGGDHNRCERSRCVVYRRKTAREAVKRIQTGLEMKWLPRKKKKGPKMHVRPAKRRASSDEPSVGRAHCIRELCSSSVSHGQRI
jgi:hypothetical protein